ncbi:MAG: glycosyltransferase family 2 protein, partial [Balneolaceae bacterium]|nr:glycosyltransferase family 2 protein [Balneolaceae bacterium]
MLTLSDILYGINELVIIYFIIVNGIYCMLLAVSFFHIRRYRNIDRIFKLKGVYSTNLYKPISLIAPAYNEEESIIDSVNSLLNLKYTNYEVVVVNDGSTDQTLQKLIEYYHLKPQQRHRPKFIDHQPIEAIYTSDRYPKLVVIDKENGGKADALNAGINIANKDLFCAVDADSILEPDALTKMLRVFMEDDTTI